MFKQRAINCSTYIMVGIGNALAAKFSIALSNNAAERNKLTKAALTGEKQDLSAVDYILGTRARCAVNGYKNIVKQVGYGINLTNAATTILTNLQSQIEEIKSSLISLNNADHITLQAAEKNYQEQWNCIFTILENTEFVGKKLFDGTFAKVPQVRLAAHNLPEHAYPFEIQLDRSDPSDKLSVHIPRLLPGDGTVYNPPVDGTYMPICQIGGNVQKVLDAVGNIPNTNLNACSNHSSWAILPGGGGRPFWNGQDRSGSFGDQLRIIGETLPEGISAELDLARRFCSNWFYQLATSMATFSPNNTETRARTLLYLNYTKSLVPIFFIPNISNTIGEGVQEITQIIRAINAFSRDEISQQLNDLPNNENISYIFRVLRKVSLDYFKLVGHSSGGVIGIKEHLISQLNKVKDYIINNYVQLDKSFLIGSILTITKCNKVHQILDYANDTLTKVISDLRSQQNNLTAMVISLDVSVTKPSELSGNYLSANYEEIVPKLIQLLRKDRLAFLAFALSEKAINSVISQMENIASHKL